MQKNSTLVLLLREVADAVERVGEAQVRTLLRQAGTENGQARLPMIQASMSKKTPAARKLSTIRQELVRQSLQQLRTSESRNDGLERLRQADFSRRELEALARLIDIPIRKDQKVEDLEELIVNITVGGRLNSKAIRHG